MATSCISPFAPGPVGLLDVGLVDLVVDVLCMFALVPAPPALTVLAALDLLCARGVGGVSVREGMNAPLENGVGVAVRDEGVSEPNDLLSSLEPRCAPPRAVVKSTEVLPCRFPPSFSPTPPEASAPSSTLIQPTTKRSDHSPSPSTSSEEDLVVIPAFPAAAPTTEANA